MSSPDALQLAADHAITRCQFQRFIFVFAVNGDFIEELKRRLGLSFLLCDAQFQSLEMIRQSIERHCKVQKKIIRPSREPTACDVELSTHVEQRCSMQSAFVLVHNADVGGIKKPSTETLIWYIEGTVEIAR